jgi:isoleucyl-tRNA synthetase
MSKSLGNVIQPQAVIKESGAEILRLWVAMSDFREELRVGKQILQRVIEAYRKFRNTLRYLASNLYDFDPETDRVPLERMQEVDRFVLSRYGATAAAVLRGYERYDYPGIFQTLNQFLTVDLSAFYADVSKDCLYTFAAGSPERRSAQTAMYEMADGLARLLAPILPVTADEMWRHLPTFAEAAAGKPGPREESVHLADFPRDVERLVDTDLDTRWTRLREIRDLVNGALETARQEKLIGTSLAARVTLTAGGETAALLRRYEADLPMLFIVSQVTLDAAGPDGVTVTVARADGEKCERCWRTVPGISRAPGSEGLCSRCVDALGAGNPSTGLGAGGGREVA